MKKNLLALALILFGYGVFSQALKNSVPSGNPEISSATMVGATNDENTSAASSRNVSAKAVKNFKKSFKNVSGEMWYGMPDGYRVKFTLNGMHSNIFCKVDYNKKGNWQHIIRTYDEKELTKDIRDQVRTTYFDYTIVSVEEITLPHAQTTYVVHLEGSTQWINIRIVDGEMDEFQKYNK